jgi:hypothetical protein
MRLGGEGLNSNRRERPPVSQFGPITKPLDGVQIVPLGGLKVKVEK